MAPPIRALLVDDDPDFRFLLGFVLHSRKIEFDACGDAATALRLFTAHRQDLILLDWRLPDRSGLELAQQIRGEEGGDTAVILLITGSGSEDSLEKALDWGVDDYVTKPVDPGVLNIRLAIAQRRVMEAREQRAREAQLGPNAMTDPLTGLATRAILRDRIQSGIFRRQRDSEYLFALLCLDLDGFRLVNEELGKEGGDRVLREAARRIEGSIRSVDTAARITADEFGVFLDDLKEVPDVTRVTNRLRERFAEPMQLAGRNSYVGATMGIALSTASYVDPEEILRDASRALRIAKGEGGGSIRIFSPNHHEAVSAQVEMEERIRRALDRDEMVLHYQPILSLRDARIVGLEALIRWPTPQGEFIPASEFIPLAERTGLVAHLGWWTLERACRQAQAWHREFPEYPPVAVMVNVPGKSFSGPELVPSVLRILDQTGFHAEHLHLEITETSAMTDVSRSLETLRALKDLGVHLHVDDFGTGYSSLSYLHRFPVDSLKVDRSFVAGMTDGPENLAIVRTVVDLAQNLGLSVVAEGVETRDQLETLRGLGCDYVQGWLFAKAMPPSQVADTLRNPEGILGDLLPTLPAE